MGEVREVRVPDIGDFESVDVVEVLVTPGQRIEAEAGLITLESEKASMDVPSPHAGTVEEIRVAAGDKVAEGDLILTLAAEGEEPGAEEEGKKKGGPEREEKGKGKEEGEGEGPEPPGRAPSRKADLEAEVVVLGGGPGGYTAAFRAADLGKDVVLVERYPTLGGVCLNVGCIPSKALLHAAKVLGEAAAFAEHGIDFGEPDIDLEKLRSWKDGVVRRLTDGLDRLADRRRVRVVQGKGVFTSGREMEIEGAEGGKLRLAFGSAIVAAGSRPVELPELPADDPRVMDSTAALRLEEVPGRLLLVGGGIIGLEMAMVYGALGAELTVAELTDGLIPGCDRDLVEPLQKRLEGIFGAAIHLRTRVAQVEAQKKGLKVHFQGEGAPSKAQTFHRILVAVGRRPNGDRIGAEAAGLEVGEGGFLAADGQGRTNVPHIFAIGDIVGPPLLAHKASHQGKVAADAIAGGKGAFDARAVPAVAYTDPEIAWAGLSETRAQEEGIPYEKGAFPWAASGRALGMGRDDGLTKLLFDPRTRRILGAGVVGPNAGDLISELALAIEMGCEAADIALTVHPHPTLSETAAFAAEAYEGTITDLYLPRRRRA